MRFDLDTVKTTVQENPVEIAAAVVAVGLIGTLCYQSNKQREHELKLAKLQLKASRPPWYSHFAGRRQPKSRYVLDFAA